MTTVLAVWGACAAPESPPAPTVHTAETDDRDGDGFGRNDDCDDADATVFPGAPDPEGDGVDQSCDGLDGVPAPLPRGECVGGERRFLRFGSSLDLEGPRLLVGSDEFPWPRSGESVWDGPGQITSWDLAEAPALLATWEGSGPMIGERVRWAGDDWFATSVRDGIVRCVGGLRGACEPAPFDPAASWLLDAGDVDGDGGTDLLALRSSTQTDHPTPAVWSAPSFTRSAILAGDAHRVLDGRVSQIGIVVALAGSDAGPATVARWSGPLEQETANLATASWSVEDVALAHGGDLDGDGLPEVVVIEGGAPRPVRVLGLEQHDTDTNPSWWWTAPRASSSASDIDVIDLDGDGIDDLVLAIGWPASSVAVWFGPLMGDLAAPDRAWGAGAAGALAASGAVVIGGDVDGDGDGDLVVGAPGVTVGDLPAAGEVCVVRGPVARP